MITKYMIRSREKHYRWKGGRTTTSQGYIAIARKHHPYSDCRGYVMEHRYLMELELGRYLTKYEEVDHINGIKTDNRIENLRIMSKGQHTQRHSEGNMHKQGKHKDTSDRQCFKCGSKKTTIIKPTPKSLIKTPFPKWLHMPYDKINWYCYNCNQSYMRTLKTGGI